MPISVQFFSEAHRQKQFLFWVKYQFFLRPQYMMTKTMTLEANESGSGSDNDPDERVIEHSEDEGDLVDFGKEIKSPNNENLETDRENLISLAESLIDVVRGQIEFGYTEFLEIFMESKTKNCTFLHEIQQQKRQRTVPNIWYINIHPVALYYR